MIDLICYDATMCASIYSDWSMVFERADDIVILYCSLNDLEEIPEEIGLLKALRCFDCSYNKLKRLPHSLCTLPYLVNLICHDNQLEELPFDIGTLSQLSSLICYSNHLTFFPRSISELRSLQTLSCYNNYLSSLPNNMFDGLVSLTHFTCSNNRLTQLPETFGEATNLLHVAVSNNRLTHLPSSVSRLRRLRHLYCCGNSFLTLPIELIYCQQLDTLECDVRPFNHNLSAPLLRFIRRIQSPQKMKPVKSLYTDNQNVHASSVQSSVKKSIETLLQDRLTSLLGNSNEVLLQLIITNPFIYCKQELIEFIHCEDEYSHIPVTFADVCRCVISRIELSPHKTELYQRLNEEMSDATCKCFTGRMTRIVNVLVGYFSDINIEISSSEQIGSVVSAIKLRHLIPDGHDFTVEAMQDLQKELRDRGYSENVIEEWTIGI